jgi:Ser/Thr protein kinase RdoA (MazF antagonist)
MLLYLSASLQNAEQYAPKKSTILKEGEVLIFFPATYSLLSLDALLSHLQENYELQEPASLQFFLRGMNDTYILTAGQDKYIFRVYRADRRNRTEISFELDLLQDLYEKKVKVSVPIARRDGLMLNIFPVPEGIRYGVLFSFAIGEERPIRTQEDSGSIGRAVAQIHHAADSFTTTYKRPELDLVHLIDKPLCIIQSHLVHRPGDFVFLHELVMRLREKLNVHVAQGLDWGICHGDLHGNTNVAFAADGQLTHYDFDICGYGWRAYDIAEFRLAREIHSGHDQNEVEGLWNAFLAGYQATRRLSENDIEAVPLFVALRQLWLFGLCFSESEFIGSADVDEGFIDDKLNYFRGLNLV